jgi:alkylation response protein AidB-like acyl-CoA dehydrogenase
MTTYRAPLGEIGFVIERIAGLPKDAEIDQDDLAAVLAEAGRFAEAELVPLNATGDRPGAMLRDGEVHTAPGFRQAYERFAEGGWMGLVFPEEHGGQGLPWTLNTAVAEILAAADITFQLCPLLTQGTIEALLRHADRDHQASWLPPLVAGRWTGAMCLTEPQAGSDLAAIRSTAEPADDPMLGPHHRLRGQKVFISWGDHDLTSNLVHLVLARLPDAPSGSKGISLFLVPKRLPDGSRNDWRVLKLEEKLGLHASPTCVVAYGDGPGAVGYLVGAPHGGLAAMFTMMNNARISVGVQGLGLAERAFQGALAYARERRQGQRHGRPAALVDHPDIRRTLLGMRARIAAMRALCLVTAAAVDRAVRDPDLEERRRADLRVALLTPIVKAWCTDGAVAITSDAIQVAGGAGYVEETGLARLFRDARVLPIYEGTNGIQALDLAGRKLRIEDGQLPWQLFAELEETRLDEALRPTLTQALDRLKQATLHMQGASGEAREAAATPYLDLFGWVLGAHLVAMGAHAAEDDPRGHAWPGLARFYVERLLPPALGLAEVVESAAPLEASWLAG